MSFMAGFREIQTFSETFLTRVTARFREILDDTLRNVAVNYTVHESTRSATSNRTHQDWIKSNGKNAGTNPDAFQDDLPLDLTGYMEEKLQPEQHYVISHTKSVFAIEIKRRRILDYENTGNRFWFRYSQSEHRIAYTEADRDLMDEVWCLDQMQQYIQRQVISHEPTARMNGSGRHDRKGTKRSGPFAHPPKGDSCNVTCGGISSFFGRLVAPNAA